MVNFCVVLAVSLCVFSGLQAAVEPADPHCNLQSAGDAEHHCNYHTNEYCEEGHSILHNMILQSTNLSEYIWNAAAHLVPKVHNTTFISGVIDGNMNPNFYGQYILQDAIYCRRVQQLWVQLASNASVDEKVREYAKNSSSGYKSCSDTLFDDWNVKDNRGDGYGVIAREPVSTYVTFIEDTMRAKSQNMLIATYACLKLWNNLTNDLIKMVNTSNPYGVWVHDNYGSGSSMKRQAAQMDEWDQKYQMYNRTEAEELFLKAMENEINFFQKGGSRNAYVELDTTKNSKELESMKVLQIDEYMSTD